MLLSGVPSPSLEAAKPAHSNAATKIAGRVRNHVMVEILVMVGVAARKSPALITIKG